LLPHHRFVDTGSRSIYGKTPLSSALEKSFPPEALGSVTVIQDDKPLTSFWNRTLPKDASIESQGRLSKTETMFTGSLLGVQIFGMTDIEFYALSCKGAADLTLKLTQHWKAAFRSMLEFQAIDQSAPLRSFLLNLNGQTGLHRRM